MLKSKKTIALFAVLAVMLMSFGASALAADVTYDTGSLSATSYVWMDDADPGYSFDNSSYKTIDDASWKINSLGISNMQGTYGINIYPKCRTNSDAYGTSTWIHTTFTSYRYPGVGHMCDGETYDLRCRIDTQYSGSWMEVWGAWNAN